MSTHHVGVVRTIDAPVTAVWAVIDDTSRFAEWVETAIEVTEHHGPARVGGVYRERNRIAGPLIARSAWTVREVVPQTLRVDTATGYAGMRDLVNTFRFAAVPQDATEVTWEVTFRLPLGRCGAPLGRLLENSIAGELDRSLGALGVVVSADLKRVGPERPE